MPALHDACGRLFDSYPLAAEPLGGTGTAHHMVLMLEDQFFTLTRVIGKNPPLFYWAAPWDEDPSDDVKISAHGTEPGAPRQITEAITRGVPVPRDGSMLGWKNGKTITALIVFYTTATREQPEPAWSVMPHADITQRQWPPFTGERLFTRSRFWDHYRAGSIVSLAGLVAASPRVVFWADTQAILGSNCCIAAHDVPAPGGWTLPQGRSAYYEALRAGKPVPPLSVLLADPSATDLAPRFRLTPAGGYR
jgi:hypothetical protein